MNAGRLANTLQLTWKAMRLAWIVLNVSLPGTVEAFQTNK